MGVSLAIYAPTRQTLHASPSEAIYQTSSGIGIALFIDMKILGTLLLLSLNLAQAQAQAPICRAALGAVSENLVPKHFLLFKASNESSLRRRAEVLAEQMREKAPSETALLREHYRSFLLRKFRQLSEQSDQVVRSSWVIKSGLEDNRSMEKVAEIYSEFEELIQNAEKPVVVERSWKNAFLGKKVQQLDTVIRTQHFIESFRSIRAKTLAILGDVGSAPTREKIALDLKLLNGAFGLSQESVLVFTEAARILQIDQHFPQVMADTLSLLQANIAMIESTRLSTEKTYGNLMKRLNDVDSQTEILARAFVSRGASEKILEIPENRKKNMAIIGLNKVVNPKLDTILNMKLNDPMKVTAMEKYLLENTISDLELFEIFDRFVQKQSVFSKDVFFGNVDVAMRGLNWDSAVGPRALAIYDGMVADLKAMLDRAGDEYSKSTMERLEDSSVRPSLMKVREYFILLASSRISNFVLEANVRSKLLERHFGRPGICCGVTSGALHSDRSTNLHLLVQDWLKIRSHTP